MESNIQVYGSAAEQVLKLLESFGASLKKSGAVATFLDDASSLVGRSSRGQTLVLNLEKPKLVQLSNEHEGEIKWFSLRDPRELLGPLLDHYRGTYYVKAKHEIAYCSDTDLEFLALHKGLKCSIELLAAVCIARTIGVSKNQIQQALFEPPQIQTGLSRIEGFNKDLWEVI